MAPMGPPAAGKLRTQQLVCAGRTRRFVLYVPSGHDGRSALPLVLNLHGSTSYPEEQMMFSDMARAADRHRVAVLAPEALERAWNVPEDPAAPDDVAFVAEAIATAEGLLPTASGGHCATGFSGGARMLARLAAGLPNPLRAIAPVAGIRFDSSCPPDRRPTVVAFHGTLDRVNPNDGGGYPYWQSGVEEAVEAWVRHNGLAACARRPRASVDVVHTVHGEGPGRVEFYRIDNLGHIWPGFPVRMGELFDPPNPAVKAAEIMLEAFASVG